VNLVYFDYHDVAHPPTAPESEPKNENDGVLDIRFRKD